MFARLPTVIQATGLGRSTVYQLVANGSFLPLCILARVRSPGVSPTFIGGVIRAESRTMQ